MGKFTRWYDQQNETTKAYLDAQWKQDLPLVYHGIGIGFLLGFVTGFLLFIG